MNLKEILRIASKFTPYVGIALGYSNYKMAKEAQRARLEAATNENNRLLETIAAKENTIIANQAKQNEITRLSIDASEQINSANTYTYNRRSKELIDKLNNPNITQTERAQITESINNNINDEANSLIKANNKLQEIIDELLSNNSNTNYIDQSYDYLNQFNILIDKCNTFFATLKVEQFSPIINLLGLIVILSCVISIIIIIYSDYLIKYFNIESKYHRISKFIQLRRKFQ
jgi:hypothetical protein